MFPLCQRTARRPAPCAGRIARLAVSLAAFAVAAAACNQAAPTASLGSSSVPASPVAQASGSPVPTSSAGLPVATQPTDLVTAFYYVWYGSLAHDGGWRHWNQLDHQPPADIASSFYPLRGAYSSRDPQVLTAQLTELHDAGVGAVAVSWWGPGSWDDQTLNAVFAAALQVGIKVAFHIEPYTGRTADSIGADIHALLARYGDSPALLRFAHPTSASASTAARPVFYIFASNQLPADGLRNALTGIRGTPDDSIVLLHSPRARTAVRDGADGVYTYDPTTTDPGAFTQLVADCNASNLICSPSVSPGFDSTHAVAGGQSIDRANGARYDTLWQAALAAHPEWVSIVSYNEWHEGTAIEPAQPFSTDSRQYLSFEGAYGLTGTAASSAYLQRTAHWVGVFEGGH